MKRLALIALGVVGTFFVILVAVPFFVDVDKYRPQIVAAVNQKIQGELKLGALKLSLVGGISVKAEGIELKANGFTKPLLNTDSFHLDIPFWALLTGRPKIIAVLNEPKIFVEKNAAGKMNAMTLIPESGTTTTAASTASTTAPAADAKTTSTAATQVPAFVAAASFGLRIHKGDLLYTDAQSNANYSVLDLELQATDIGLMTPMNLTFTAPLKGQTPAFSFSGPVSGHARISPVLAGGQVRSASGNVEIDADKLSFTMPKLITKTDSMPMSAKLAFEGSDKDILIKQLELKFFDFTLNGKGLVNTAPEVGVRLELNSNELGLARLHDLVPMLKTYDLKGKLGLNAKIEASAAQLKANGDLKLTEGEFSYPGILKSALNLSLQAGFTENSLNILKAELKGPDSDIALQGNIQNFMAPQFSLNLNGKSWNIDKTVVLPEMAAKSAALSLIPDAFAAPAPQLVNPLAAMAKNPIMAKANGTLNANLGNLIVYNAKLENVNVKAQLSTMLLKLTQASLKTFGGNIASTGEFDLKSEGLLYKSAGKVQGISAKEAVMNYFPRYKNTLEGITDADWNVSGSLYPDTARLKSLKGTAKLSARDGFLRTIDFKETIQGTLAKVPFLKSAKAPNLEEGFKTFTANISFDNGNTKVDPVYYLGKGKGLEMKGKSLINEALEQDSYLDIFDPNGVLPAELRVSGKPAIALHVTGLLTGPKVDYEYTVKKLAGTAGKAAIQNQLGKFLSGKAGGGQQGDKAAPADNAKEAVKNLGDQLKKKFRF